MSSFRKIIEQNNHHVVLRRMFIVLGLAIPFSTPIIRYVLIVFFSSVALAILNRPWNWRKFPDVKFSHVLVPAYFFLCAISLLYPPSAFSWLERGWMLLVFPLILVYFKNDIKTLYCNFLKGFIAGTVAMGCINLIIATIHSIRMVDGSFVFDSSAWGGVPFLFSIDHYGNFYFSNYFSSFSHPTYASLMVTLAFAIILIINPFRWSKRIQVLVAFFQLLIILLLSSRAGFIGALISLLVIIFLSKNKLPLPLRSALFIVFVLTISFVIFHPRTNALWASRTEIFHSNTRIVSWRCALEGIENNWLLGVGLHGVQQELNERYEQHGQEEHLAEEYNTHNQFLETWLGMGIMGLALLSLIFFYGFRIAIQFKNLFGIVMMANLLIHFSFEAMLIRFDGIIIFALFVPFLLLVKTPAID